MRESSFSREIVGPSRLIFFLEVGSWAFCCVTMTGRCFVHESCVGNTVYKKYWTSHPSMQDQAIINDSTWRRFFVHCSRVLFVPLNNLKKEIMTAAVTSVGCVVHSTGPVMKSSAWYVFRTYNRQRVNVQYSTVLSSTRTLVQYCTRTRKEVDPRQGEIATLLFLEGAREMKDER